MRKLARALKAFNPAQARIPAGNPDGGQWTSEDSGLTPVAQFDKPREFPERLRNDRYINKHIWDDHIEKTDEALKKRIKESQVRGWFFSEGIDRNGSFDSEESARDLIRQTLENNPEAVSKVASGRESKPILLTWRYGFRTGREAFVDGPDLPITIRPTYNVGVGIIHDPRSEFGYRVTTAFPRNYYSNIGR